MVQGLQPQLLSNHRRRADRQAPSCQLISIRLQLCPKMGFWSLASSLSDYGSEQKRGSNGGYMFDHDCGGLEYVCGMITQVKVHGYLPTPRSSSALS